MTETLSKFSKTSNSNQTTVSLNSQVWNTLRGLELQFLLQNYRENHQEGKLKSFLEILASQIWIMKKFISSPISLLWIYLSLLLSISKPLKLKYLMLQEEQLLYPQGWPTICLLIVGYLSSSMKASWISALRSKKILTKTKLELKKPPPYSNLALSLFYNGKRPLLIEDWLKAVVWILLQNLLEVILKNKPKFKETQRFILLNQGILYPGTLHNKKESLTVRKNHSLL